MYNWFNRFCVGRARLFPERNNEGGGNSDPLCCILARKPVVRTLRGASRPPGTGHLKIRIYDWPAVWCARGGRKYQPFMHVDAIHFSTMFLHLNNIWLIRFTYTSSQKLVLNTLYCMEREILMLRVLQSR